MMKIFEGVLACEWSFNPHGYRLSNRHEMVWLSVLQKTRI